MAQARGAHFTRFPDSAGCFGAFGGNHAPIEIAPALAELTNAYLAMRGSEGFHRALEKARTGLQGRPTPVHHLANLSEQIGGAQIFVKREDLNHTGAHKINHCLGFALLARRMGKSKLIAETGAGQHGVALATAAAYFGLECEVHMGANDIEKQKSNAARMRLLGATIVTATAGQAALKEASDAAFNSYVEQHADAIYAIGSAIGPHPFPMIVRDFQSVVGREARKQFSALTGNVLPNHVVACVAGGSNAIGIYAGFIDEAAVALHAAEPFGSSNSIGNHAATLSFGRLGILHGARTLLLQEDDGSPAMVSSVASGLVYPGVGPELAMLQESGRLTVAAVPDQDVVQAFFRVTRQEGIIPALESAHALALAIDLAARRPAGENILVNLSGRGDKDVDYVMANYGTGEFENANTLTDN